MRERNASTIRILLRSGEITDIGGRPEGLTPVSVQRTDANLGHAANLGRRARPSRVRLVAAFAAVYLVWGSTYLGIRYAIDTIPSLLMMGMRHLLAGGFLYAWVRWRGTPAPRLREWTYPAVIGALLFLGGHGSLAWAEQRVPSGITALLVATLPIWIAVLARMWGTERHLSGRALAGLGLGFAGVAGVFCAGLLHYTPGSHPLGAGAGLVGDSLLWAGAP